MGRCHGSAASPTAYAGAMELIVLWDIDHTLIENARVSKEIYAAAFSALSGREPTGPARTEGRTDRLIMRDMFLRDGLSVPDWPSIEAALTQAGQERLGDLRFARDGLARSPRGPEGRFRAERLGFLCPDRQHRRQRPCEAVRFRPRPPLGPVGRRLGSGRRAPSRAGRGRPRARTAASWRSGRRARRPGGGYSPRCGGRPGHGFRDRCGRLRYPQF